MSAYGYEIVQTLIVDIEPDEHVKRSMNEINAGDISIIFAIFNTIGRLCSPPLYKKKSLC
jgi:hypothetical protein